jgi:hypothetical protein
LCTFAILSKYSVAYTVALPWAAILIFRRGALSRKLSFLIQPVIVLLIVGPWALLTRRLAYYGLPVEQPALTAARAASFLAETFEVFPPVLMALVIIGLIALLASPRSWRDDVGVLCLLCAAHLSFLFLSPVGAEQRYLLVPAVSLLALSFAGWAAALSRLPYHGRYDVAVRAAVPVLTAIFVVARFGAYPRPNQYPIRQVVDTVLNNKAWSGQPLLAPSDLEGPFIAEFLIRERARPSSYVVRPSKLLARVNWFGGNYALVVRTPQQMAECIRRNAVRLIVWHRPPEDATKEHERILANMLLRYPSTWVRSAALGGGGMVDWAIYEQAPHQGMAPINP